MKTIRQIYIRGVDRTGDVAAIAEVKNAYRIRFQNSPKTYFYPKKQIRLLERSPALGEAWPEIFSYFKDFCFHAAEHEPSAEGRSAWTLARRNLKRVEVRSARDTALADYLQAQVRKRRLPTGQALIYPFGCNQSQKKAVEAAFSASISVIQGPPGTGKTQTILNIIANITEDAEWLKYITPFGYAEAADIITNAEIAPLPAAIGCFVTAAAISAAFIIYNRKDIL